MHIQVFCRVVDNFGDIGVCWRLARCWHNEYQQQVQLFVDDLASFQRIQSNVKLDVSRQTLEGVQVVHWQPSTDWTHIECADVVVEAFACELPLIFLERVRKSAVSRSIAWINLEYLSAEAWVESCHRLPSIDPQTGVKKYFFFPGFSEKLGGLNFEPQYVHRQQQFYADVSARVEYLRALGIDVEADHLISIFCYPDAPLTSLLEQVIALKKSVHVICPQGVADSYFEQIFCSADWMQLSTVTYCHDEVFIHRIPFSDQADYDRLLWCCDLNFVRGEDSFIRAQLAGVPMVWHIYPQEDNAHLEKLNAFNQLYLNGLPDDARRNYQSLSLAWNQAQDLPKDALTFLLNDVDLKAQTKVWREKILAQGDLAGQILHFVNEIG